MLDFGTGPTYTEVAQKRRIAYMNEGPDLIKDLHVKLEDLQYETTSELLSELNDIALGLSALDPTTWSEFSFACFEGLMEYMFSVSKAVSRDIFKAFDAVRAKIGYIGEGYSPKSEESHEDELPVQLIA